LVKWTGDNYRSNTSATDRLYEVAAVQTAGELDKPEMSGMEQMN